MSYAIVIDGDLIEGYKLFRNTLREGAHSEYLLFEDSESADSAAQENWKQMDSDELVAMIGADKIVEIWRRGESFEDWLNDIDADNEFGQGGTSLDVDSILDYVSKEYPELIDWVDEMTGEHGNDYSFWPDEFTPEVEEDEDAEDEDSGAAEVDVDDANRVIEILKGWQELIDELGFTPTIAYKN
jgi:hypothetical protein